MGRVGGHLERHLKEGCNALLHVLSLYNRSVSHQLILLQVLGSDVHFPLVYVISCACPAPGREQYYRIRQQRVVDTPETHSSTQELQTQREIFIYLNNCFILDALERYNKISTCRLKSTSRGRWKARVLWMETWQRETSYNMSPVLSSRATCRK